MKRIVLLAALLVGCADKREIPPPAVQIKTVTVTKEVQRPCGVTRPAKPAPLSRPLPTDLTALAATLTIKLLEYAGPGGYAERADAAIATCMHP